jgi:hypothetical protein
MAEAIQDTGQSTADSAQQTKRASNTELFRASKKLFLKAVAESQCEETKMRNISALKCLVLDCDPEISKEAMRVLTKMLREGDEQLANYIIDLGLGFLPNISAEFSEVDFKCLVEFVDALLLKEPSWICDKLLKPIENLIIKSVLSPEEGLVGFGFSMIQKNCRLRCSYYFQRHKTSFHIG